MTDEIGNKIQSKVIELKTEDRSRRCDFCKKSEIKSQEWGGFYCLEDVTVHYFCLLFSSGLHQNGEDHEGIMGFLVPDIKKEIRRGKRLRCKYCKQYGATIGCVIKKCKSSFHYTCGLPMGTLNCFGHGHESYCPIHKPVVRIPDDLEDYECSLCMSDLKKDENPVWSPCCKTRVFHRECIQAYAYSAGYYHFKCPHCNSKKKFRKAMQKSGIYVPKRDAAWETEPDAFADLNQVYSSCDAKLCWCPNGKDFQDNSKWKIYRCTTCGSAIHQWCGKVNSTKWICTDCFPVVGEGSLSRHQAPSQSSSSSDEEIGDNQLYFQSDYKNDDIDKKDPDDVVSTVPMTPRKTATSSDSKVKQPVKPQPGRKQMRLTSTSDDFSDDNTEESPKKKRMKPKESHGEEMIIIIPDKVREELKNSIERFLNFTRHFYADILQKTNTK